MLQTNPIHQSQHGVLHADESFKALLVYSRYHKWLPEDGCLQLDPFFLYSIFLFLNEVLVFLWVFWGGFVFCLVLMMPSEYPLPVSGSTWEHFPVAVEVYPPWLLCFLCIFFLNHNRNKLANQGKSYPFTPLLSDKNQNSENSV